MEQFMKELVGLVAAHRGSIEAAARRSHAEAEGLRTQLREAEDRARFALTLLELGAATPSRDIAGHDNTLHAAMRAVLIDAPEYMMRAGDLAAEIQRRQLYSMRDGRPVEAQQIHARVGHYGHMFEKVGTFIRLREEHR